MTNRLGGSVRRFTKRSALALAGLCCGLPIAGADAQVAKEFRDWWVACDNTLTCAAYGFSPESAGDGSWIRIRRAGTAEAAPEVVFGWGGWNGADGVAKGTRLRLSFDDPKAGEAPSPLPLRISDDSASANLPAGAASGFIVALRKAQRLNLELIAPPDAPRGKPAGDAPTKGVISLSGAVAALLFMDDHQHRIGTTTALIRAGDKPASSIPAPPAPPRIVPVPGGKGELPPPRLPASVAALMKSSECDAPTEGEAAKPVAYRLTDKLTLWGATCDAAAYNIAVRFFLVTDGKAKPALFEQPPGAAAGGPPPNELGLPSFDAATGIMTSLVKGRGIGDCGTAGTWAWDGSGFRLVSLASMDPCRGVPIDDWPTLYRASTR